MKKVLFYLVIVSLLFTLSCGKKKQKEAAEKAKIETDAAINSIVGIVVDKNYVDSCIFVNKENSPKEIISSVIPAGEKITYVYKEKSYKLSLNKSLPGTLEGKKIQTRNGYIETKGIKFFTKKFTIEGKKEFYSKAGLMPWIEASELDPYVLLKGKVKYPLNSSLEYFKEFALNSDTIYLNEGPRFFVTDGKDYWMYNNQYEPWLNREQSEAARKIKALLNKKIVSK
ncbi:hypothetical protein GW932_01440 [archaeon]|nr:hypothetical protein [archaeon]